jgi:hypothetical protein
MTPSRFRRLARCLPLACAAALLGAATASAQVVTIGSPLQGSFTWPAIAAVPTSYVNGTLANPEAELTAPFDGAVIRWRLSEGFEGGPFRLQIMKQGENGSAVGGQMSAPVNGSEGTFATNLPINEGQSIALTTSGTDALLGARLSPATQNAQFFEYSPPLNPDGVLTPLSTAQEHQELGFNADVLPTPTATGLAAPIGAAVGGTTVTITGTQFIMVSKVSFGSKPAASFKVESENKIVATAPAGTPSSSVRVSVTTPAGTATAPTKFTYAAKPKPKPKSNVKPKGSGPRPAHGGGHRG